MPQPASFEQFDRAPELRPPSGRVFGFALAVPFAIAAFSKAVRGGQVRWWAAGVSAAFALTALLLPRALEPLARAWVKVQRPVHHAVTLTVMALLFFLPVSFVGRLRRLFVKDPLRLRFDSAASTYWQERKPSDPANMANQF